MRRRVKYLSVAVAALFTAAAAKAQDPEQTAASNYQGPSILSRDSSIVGERSGKLLDYRFYAQVTGVYDTSLTPVSVDPSGQLVKSGGADGIEAGMGIEGTRSWKHDTLSVDYHGAYRHYPNTTYFDSVDQFLDLKYQHLFTRRLSLQLNETGGISSLTNGTFTYVPLSSVDQYAVPTNELFDNRTEYSLTRAVLTYQKTLRLSFSVGGSGYLVRRRSEALASLNGYSGYADMAYRLTKRQTIAVNFQYVKFDYLRSFGDATVYGGGLDYSIALGRTWDLAFDAGLVRVDATGLSTITLDPAIAQIVGRSTATTVFHSHPTIPTYQGRVVHRFEHAAATLFYANSFSPGNGVYLSSRQMTSGADFSYTGLRRISLGASASYTGMGSFSQGLGNYQGETGGLGVTYMIASWTHIEARYDYRHYETASTGFRKNSQRVSLGLAFSPGEKPLSIW